MTTNNRPLGMGLFLLHIVNRRLMAALGELRDLPRLSDFLT